MSQKEELKDRIVAKRKRLEAQLSELKADARSASREQANRLQSQLDELNESLKGGWENLTESVARRLNDWLKND